MKRKIISAVLSACLALSCFAAGSTAIAVSKDKTATGADYPDTYSEVSANPYSITGSNSNPTILQAWNWSYKNLEKELPKVAQQGFSVVQISPPNEIKAATKGVKADAGDKNGWWMFYQPAGFQINKSTDNALGTKDELVHMVKTAHSYGVRVIADSVINHMGTCDGEDKITSTDPMAHVTPKAKEFEKEIWDNKLFHNPWFNMTYKEDASKYSQYDSTYDLTRGCTSRLPDLKTEDPRVQTAIYDYLQELVDCGIDGFRFDAAKHIETDKDISSLKSDFLKNTITKVRTYAKNTYKKDLISYGEILNSCGVNRRYSAYFPYMKVTDSGVFWALSDAVNNRDANAANISDGQFNEKSKVNAVLWDESHDTFCDGATTGFSTEKRNKMWALIAARDGITAMYFARPGNSKADLKNVTLGDAKETDWAKSAAVAGVNKFNNIYADQSEYLDVTNGVVVIGRGSKTSNGGAVLVNMKGTSGSVSGATVHTMADGKYTDIIGGKEFTVKSGKISGTFGATGVAAIYPTAVEPTQPATEAPTQAPTQAPTDAPTQAPTNAPTDAPTQAPTQAPTAAPTVEPTEAPTEAPTAAPTVPSQFSMGDVNRDKTLNITDVTFIQKYLLNLLPFDDEQVGLADFDGDGRVCIKDATAIQYKLIEK